MAPSGAYKTVRVGDVEMTLAYGAVGDTNPTFVNYASGVMSAGAVFEITPSKDGWLTLFTKLNPNKPQVVFEDENGPEEVKPQYAWIVAGMEAFLFIENFTNISSEFFKLFHKIISPIFF